MQYDPFKSKTIQKGFKPERVLEPQKGFRPF